MSVPTTTRPPICRLCLAVEVPLVLISGPLQQVYERISNNKLHTGDTRPVAACYVCDAQLRKCRRLMLTSARAEVLLNTILSRNPQITVQSVSQLSSCFGGLCEALALSGVECFELVPPEAAEPDAGSTDVKSEGPGDGSDLECEDIVGPSSPAQTCDTETDSNEKDVRADFPQPIRVVVSGVKIEDAGSGCPDADDNCPLESLRAETRVERELRGDGASAHKSGSEKQERADVTVADSRLPNARTNECDVCHKQFPHKSLFDQHYRTHTGEKPYKCDVCPKRYSRKSAVERHYKTHVKSQQPRFYECDLCQNTYLRKQSMIVHMRTHTGQRPYGCNVCQNRYTRRSHLISHLRTHNKRLYECNVCQISFTHRGALKTHYNIHKEERPYVCDICLSRFSEKESLSSHLKTHAGEKLHECYVCEKKFYSTSNLSKHIRSHTGVKPYECDICQGRFCHKDNLVRHLSIHTGEKPYECGVCKLKFRAKSILKVHSRIHSEEKCFECIVCQSRFRLKTELLRHAKIHEEEERYVCHVCKKQLQSNRALIYHLGTHMVTS